MKKICMYDKLLLRIVAVLKKYILSVKNRNGYWARWQMLADSESQLQSARHQQER